VASLVVLLTTLASEPCPGDSIRSSLDDSNSPAFFRWYKWNS